MVTKLVRIIVWGFAVYGAVGTVAIAILRWNAIFVVGGDTKQRLLEMSALSTLGWFSLAFGGLCLLYLMMSDGLFTRLGEILAAIRQDPPQRTPSFSAQGNIRDISSRDEHTRAIREQTEAFERKQRQEDRERSARQEVADGLAEWIKKASPLRDDLQNHDAPVPAGLKLWNSEVAAYVLEKLGPVYEVRFVEPAEFSDDQLGPLGRHPANMAKLGLQERINRLHRFIEELT